MASSDPSHRQNSTEHRFPCKTCGSELRFSPADGLLVCDHCGATEDVDAGRNVQPLREIDIDKGLALSLNDEDIEETRVMACTNCGAQVEFDANTHSAECPFCATPVVTDTGAHRHIKPRGVLPFSLKERDARERMNAWLGRLWFAPNGLRDYARAGRAMQGIYAPYWTYDAKTASTYEGKRGSEYYVTRTETVMVDGKEKQRTRKERKIRWSSVNGSVSRNFDDVLILASNSLPRPYTDALAPWDLTELEPYRAEYLAGFRAESYTIPLDEGFADARKHMDRMIVRDVKFDIGGDEQQIDRLDTKVWDVTFKHILLPVWIAAYKYRGKTYRFVVNGRTGSVKGERPYSAFKIAIAVIAGLIAAGIAGYLIAQNQ